MPTTMGRGPRVPRPWWFRTFGCNWAHARTRTHPCPASSQRYSAEGSGQVLGDRCTSHLRPVAAGASDVRGRIGEARIAVEATPGAQADEDLARAPLQCPLQFDGVVTCVEDEQWGGLSFFKPTQQSSNLLGGEHVGVLGRPRTGCTSTGALQLWRAKSSWATNR